MSYLSGSSDPDSREIFGDHERVLKRRRLSTSVNFTNFSADQVQLHASDMNFTGFSVEEVMYNADSVMSPRVNSLDKARRRVSEISFSPPLASTMNHSEINRQLPDASRVELSAPNLPDASLEESSFDYEPPQPLPESETNVNVPLSWDIYEGVSNKGFRKLVENTGHTYCFQFDKRRPNLEGKWNCSHKRKGDECPVKVYVRKGLHEHNGMEHIHDPKSRHPEVDLVMRREMKRVGRANTLTSAAEIAEEAREGVPEQLRDQVTLTSARNCAEQIRNNRRGLLPKNPAKDDLHFDLDMEFMERTEGIPDNFLQGDIDLGTARHIVFASDEQLKLMKKAKTWYIDATFKVVDKPFYQLFSIHVFVREGDCMKQVPVAYVLMSRRRKKDYKAVFKFLKEKLDSKINLKRVVADFEAAAWVAVQSVFGNSVAVKGCLFHFNQAVYRKICKLDLKVSYKNDPQVERLCKALMALPLLADNHIKATFERLVENVEAADPLKIPKCQELVAYMRRTWIDRKLFNPASWCWFREIIRTNNDVEGWHNRLNYRAHKANLPFYHLIQLLGKETMIAHSNMKLVQMKELKRYQSRDTKKKQQKLAAHWDQYMDITTYDDVKALKWLEDVSKLSKPSKKWDSQADYTTGDYQADHESTK